MRPEPNRRHLHDEQTDPAYGVVTGPGTVRFERVLPGSVDRAWAYLTESEKRAKWLAAGEMELRVGGRVELDFYHAGLSPIVEPVPAKYEAMADGCRMVGRVTRCEPPCLLSYTWGDGMGDESEVAFELTPVDGGVSLVVTHRRLGDDPSRLANVAAGWHTHLGILADHLAGRTPRNFWSVHTRVEADYEQRFSPQRHAFSTDVLRALPDRTS